MSKLSFRPVCRAVLIASLASLAACRHDDAPAVGGEAAPTAPFLALRLDPSGRALPAGVEARAEPGESFYLAIHKGELDQRWFLSAYMEQFHPGGSSGWNYRSLGTRVVSFRVQNDKLFVFDVDDRKQQSDAFDPEVAIEAYPLVDPKKLGAFAGQGDYLVFDAAAGLNRFGVFFDETTKTLTQDFSLLPSPVELEATYLQRARTVDDGLTFEQVFRGRMAERGGRPNAGGVEPDPFRFSGTLGVGLRRYREGEGFTPKPPPEQDFYFHGDASLVPNTGEAARPVARWNIRPDLPPIRWVISPRLLAYQQENLPQYDFVGAVKRGIESWNEAFGFEALHAELATPDQSAGDDDLNYYIFDERGLLFSSRSDVRTNPNTGEIRGAAAKMTAGTLTWAVFIFNGPFGATPEGFVAPAGPGGPDPFAWLGGPPGADPLALGGPAAPAEPRPAWGPFAPQALCGHRRPPPRAPALVRTADDEPSVIKMIEDYVSHEAAHEIGHTLGLRHNFKGSLLPPTSSVMDLVDGLDAAETPGPQAYDVDAIRYLYDLSPEPPAQPFCADEGVALDPNCNPNDFGADPFYDTYGSLYELDLGPYLEGFYAPEDTFIIDFLVSDSLAMLDYVRAGTPDEAQAAWDFLFAPLRDPLDPAYVPGPVSIWTERLLGLLYFDNPDDENNFIIEVRAPITGDSPVAPALTADARAVLVDPTGVRDFAARRKAADVLEKLRSPASLAALTEARAEIEAQLPGLEGEPAALTLDLIARIDRALARFHD